MKKLMMVPAIAGALFMVACGPSAEEKAKQQAIADSLKQDSINKVMEAEAAKAQAQQDSIAAEQAKQQALADSLRNDSIMKAEAKGGKKK